MSPFRKPRLYSPSPDPDRLVHRQAAETGLTDQSAFSPTSGSSSRAGKGSSDPLRGAPTTRKGLLFRCIQGDTWEFEFRLKDPSDKRLPIDRDRSIAVFRISDNRFSRALWTGTWGSGIGESASKYDSSGAPSKGTVRVRVPASVTSRIRRGTYAFSMKVSDLLLENSSTQVSGSIQVEYEPASENRDIPYRMDAGDDGQSYGVSWSYPRPDMPGDGNVSWNAGTAGSESPSQPSGSGSVEILSDRYRWSLTVDDSGRLRISRTGVTV